MRFVPKIDTDRMYATPGEFGKLVMPGIIAAFAINFVETFFVDTTSWATFSENWGGWQPTGASGKAFVNEFWNNSLFNMDIRTMEASDYLKVALLATTIEAYKNTKK